MKASIFSLAAIAAFVAAEYVPEVYTSEYEVTSTSAAVEYATEYATSTSAAVEEYPTEYPATTSSAAEYIPSPSTYPLKGYNSSSPVYTTSTWYETSVYTTAGEVTSAVKTYTTVCAVTDLPKTYWPLSAPYPTTVKGGVSTYAPVYTSKAAPVVSTLTISTCVPSYYTTVVTVYPTETAKGNAPVAPAATYPAKNSTVYYTGGASAQKAGGLLMAFGLVAALL